MIRIALLGLGRISATHLEALRGNGSFRLVATCDAKNPAADFTSLEEMLERARPDMVSICTPNSLHFAHAKKCLESGAHVVVEKPLALTLRDARKLYALASSKGLEVFPLYQNRLNPTILAAQGQAPKLGKIAVVSARLFWNRPAGYFAGWRADSPVLENQGAHYIDLISLFAGGSPAKEVGIAREGKRSAAVAVRFASGMIASFAATTSADCDAEGGLAIVGERGVVEIGGKALNKISAWRPGRAPDVDYDPQSVYGPSHAPFYRKVAAALCAREKFFMPPADALASVALMEKILKSA